MRKNFIIISTLIMLSIFSFWPENNACALGGVDIGARGFYWDTSLDADMATEGDPIIDLKDDLNIGDESFGSGEIYFKWGRNRFIFSYTSVSYSGSNTLTRDITFDGTTFSASTLVDSEMEYDQIDGIYQYDFVKFNPAIASFSLGVLLQVKFVDGFAELRNGGGPPEREEFTAPVPMIGLGGSIGIINETVVVEARVAALEYSGNRAIDGQALLGFNPFPFLKIFGGYKIFDLKVDEEGFLLDYTIDGPFAGLQVNF